MVAPLHSGLSWTVYDLLNGHIVKKLTNHKACVRDVSWHPFEEKIVSSSVRLKGLGGQCMSGTCTWEGAAPPNYLRPSALQWDGNLRLWQYRQAEYFQDDMPESEEHPSAPAPAPHPSTAFSSPQ